MLAAKRSWPDPFRNAIVFRRFKKKVDTAIKTLFSTGNSTSNIEYFEALLKYAKQQVQCVLNPGKQNDDNLKLLLNKLLDFNKPQVLDLRKADNVITQMDKNYQRTLLAFQENGIQGKEFTIFEFQNTLEHFEKRNEEMKEKTNKLKSK